MRYFALLAGLAVTAFSTTGAHAELFTGSFTATITDGEIFGGPSGSDYFGISVASGQMVSPVGQKVSGTISFDTATTFPSWEVGHLIVPADGENNLAGYYPSLPFTITETINGISQSVTGTTYSGLGISQIDGVDQGTGIEVQNDGGLTPDGKSSIMPVPYPRDDFNITLYGGPDILSNFDDLNSLEISGVAGVDIANNSAFYESGDGSLFYFDAALTSLEIGPADVSAVPLPPGLPMFASALVCMVAMGWRKRNTLA